MGEAKRRKDKLTPIEEAGSALTAALTDQGLLIKAGFAGYITAVFPNGAPPTWQVVELEQAFMAGAQHLYASIMNVLDPGEEPSARDLRRMDLIDKELEDYAKVLEGRVAEQMKTKGSA